MVGLSFYGIFKNFLVIGEYNIKILVTNVSPLFLCIATIKLLKLLRTFQIILFITKMPSLIRKEKITCEKCSA